MLLNRASAHRILADAARSRSESDWLIGINGTRAITKRMFGSRAGNFASVRSTDPKRAYELLKDQLAAQLTSFKAAGVKIDDVQIIIYPQPNVTLDNLIPVEEAALDAGFKKVGFGINTTK